MKKLLINLGMTIWCACFVYGAINFTSEYEARQNSNQHVVVSTNQNV